jgi:TolB-like protein/DNA-binding winged helix-turn-helix (wHTH) protein/Tfp pilus assembly protein PilF
MLVAAPASRLLRFDSFELDVRAAELRKGGIKLRLQGQPIQVLAKLLSCSGELVTREELRAEIWPAETFVDFDHSLHNAISRIREVLGDSAETPRYIETLPRRGYRFIRPVEKVGIPEPQQLPVSEPAVAVPIEAPRTTTRAALIAGLSVVVVAAAGLVLAPALARRSSAIPSVRSIAVLPMDNFSGDPAQEYFADGMTDELITDLAKIGSLRVISRTSVMRYKGTRKGLPEIAKELNVDGIIEGSVTRSGQRVRITAQLLYGPTDKHLWAETYERDLGDILSLQSEVAQAIAQQVRAELTPQQQARLGSTRQVNPEAYDAYLRGRYYLWNDYTTPQPLNMAKQYFEESVRKDPGFALAYSGLADAYAYLGFFHQLSTESAYRSAEEALRQASALDDSIGEIHDTQAVLDWRYRWDWNGADRELQQAIALAPSYICAHEDRAEYLAFQGRGAEARAEVAKSMALDSSVSSDLTESAVDYQLRDFAGLIEASRRGMALNPKEWLEYYFLGVGYEGTGKQLEAIVEFQRAVELSGGDQDATAELAYAYAGIGRKAETRKMLHNFQRETKTPYVSPYLIATLYAGLGEKDKAFEMLEKAYREKCLDLSWSLKADLRMDSLRSDPRYKNLLHRVGLAN